MSSPVFNLVTYVERHARLLIAFDATSRPV